MKGHEGKDCCERCFYSKLIFLRIDEPPEPKCRCLRFPVPFEKKINDWCGEYKTDNGHFDKES